MFGGNTTGFGRQNMGLRRFLISQYVMGPSRSYRQPSLLSGPDRQFCQSVSDATDVLASRRSRDLGVAAGIGDNFLVRTDVVRLSSSWRIAPATAALIIAFTRVETIENRWSGDRPPSCGGSSLGRRRGLAGDLMHVEGLGATGCSRGRRTFSVVGGGHGPDFQTD
jgi:hypothetical protein